MMYFVATRVRYVLVEANDDAEASTKGEPLLKELVGRDGPVEIHTIRPATTEEIQLWNWHHEMVNKHNSD